MAQRAKHSFLTRRAHTRGYHLEALAKLRPVFKLGGSVTAGNSSPLSDGAAAVVVMERQKAEALGLTPLLRFVGFNVGGVRPEMMGIGPIAAVPRVLKRTGMKLADIDLIELNEAFAAQAVAVIRELGLNEEITQRQRRRDCAGASAGLHGGQADGADHQRNDAPQHAVRHGDDVHRRRHGRSRHF